MKFFFFLLFLGPQVWHMEIPRSGVQSELQLPTYATLSSRQYRIPGPLSEARDWTRPHSYQLVFVTAELWWELLFFFFFLIMKIFMCTNYLRLFPQLTFCTYYKTIFFLSFFFFFFLAALMSCGSSGAQNQTYATAVTQAMAMTTPDP